MDRATVAEMRKSLTIVETFKKAGIRFIPMPCRTEQDYIALAQRSMDMLEEMAVEMENKP